MQRLAILLSLSAALAAGSPARAVTLIRDGKPTSVLVTAGKPAAAARDAALMLQDYLAKATGATVPVVAESKLAPDDPRVRILVGRTRRTAELGIDVAEFQREQILLRATDRELVIVGSDRRPDGPELEGTLWAAAEFAEKHLGVRRLWPGPLGLVVPKAATIDVSVAEETYVPPLWQRHIRNLRRNERIDASLAKLGWNAADYDKLHADAADWWRFHRLGGSFQGNYGHAFGDYWDRFHQDHPDWFAMQLDGTRDNSKSDGGHRARLCKSNRGLIEQVARDTIEEMRRRRTYDTISISPNDGSRATFCLCPNCEAWDAKDGQIIEMWGPKGPIKHVSLTDRFVKFYAAVAQIVAREFPDRYLGAYAYSAYRIPPVEAKLPPNVMIGYVGFGYLNEEHRQKCRDEWLQWSRAASKLFLRPNLLAAGYALPFVYAHRLADDIRFCAEHGMLVTDFDCCFQNWATDGLNYYVLARVLWDPKLQTDQIIDDYCRAGFAKAAPAVRGYLDRLERLTDELAKSNEYSDRKSTPDAVSRQFTDAVLAELQGRLDEAKRLAPGDADVLARIEFLETGLRYVPLRRDWAAAHAASKANPSREAAAKAQEALAKKNAFYQQIGITWAINVPVQVFYGL